MTALLLILLLAYFVAALAPTSLRFITASLKPGSDDQPLPARATHRHRRRGN